MKSPAPIRPNSPNVLLDPHGNGGTSTARRLRLSRHRRQIQAVSLALIAVLLLSVVGWLVLRPRTAGFSVQSARALPFDATTAATLGDGGALWIGGSQGALWRVSARGQSARVGILGASPNAPPLVSAGVIYAPALDGSLTAFDGDKPLWRSLAPAPLSASPALWQTQILGVGDDTGEVFGLDPASGKTRWKTAVGGSVGTALTPTREGFLVPTLSGDIARGGLVCLDARTGQTRWRFPASDAVAAAGLAAPLFDEKSNRVYWSNDEGAVICLDATTGRKIWKSFAPPLRANSPLSVVLRAAPQLVGDNLIVGGEDGAVRAFKTGDGILVWTRVLGGPVRAVSAATLESRAAVLVVSAAGELVLLDAKTGATTRRGAGDWAVPMPNGKSALILENSVWKRVSWE